MWAHIGDHVDEYLVFVDQMQTKTVRLADLVLAHSLSPLLWKIVEKDFNDYFGIQFHGAKQRKRYLIHVEAKLKSKLEGRREERHFPRLSLGFRHE